jgi:hypothetical protein
MTNVKLTEEIKQEIFKSSNFRTLSNTSANAKILKTIYNDEYGLIYENVVEGHHTKYELVQDANTYYDFIKMASTRKQCACPSFCVGAHGLCSACSGYKPEKIVDVDPEDGDEDFGPYGPVCDGDREIFPEEDFEVEDNDGSTEYTELPIAKHILSAECLLYITEPVDRDREPGLCPDEAEVRRKSWLKFKAKKQKLGSMLA